jgi:hypothetical protein
MISAKELVEKEKLRRNVRKETYKALLEQFCRKIRTTSDLLKKETIVTVPPFVVGYPAYDLPSTVTYMTRQLERLGYSVSRVGLTDLHVSWGSVAASHEATPRDEDLLPTLMSLQNTANRLRRGH